MGGQVVTNTNYMYDGEHFTREHGGYSLADFERQSESRKDTSQHIEATTFTELLSSVLALIPTGTKK